MAYLLPSAILYRRDAAEKEEETTCQFSKSDCWLCALFDKPGREFSLTRLGNQLKPVKVSILSLFAMVELLHFKSKARVNVVRSSSMIV